MAPVLACMLLHVLLAPRAWAGRAMVDLAQLDDVVSSRQRSDLICGSHQIREMLSGTTVRAVRFTSWSKIMDIAGDFITSNGQLVERIRAEVDRLQLEVDKGKQSRVTDLSEQDVSKLLMSSLSTEGGFGTQEDAVERAVKTKCGFDMKTGRKEKPRVPRGAYRKVINAFKTGIKRALSPAGRLRTSSDVFLKICLGMMSAASEEPTYCNQLCEAMSISAQEESDSAAAPILSSDSAELESGLQAETLKLRHAVLDGEDCKAFRGDLEDVQKQLEPLQQDIDDQHEKLVAANDALDFAEEDMDELEDEIGEQEAVLQSAEGRLKGRTLETVQAREALQTVKESMSMVRAELESAKQAVAKARLEVMKAESADMAFKELRKAVSSAMLHMTLFVNDAVRSPLRKIGIVESLDVQGIFPGSIGELESAEDMHKALGAMNTLCEKTALPAFEKIKPKVDLTPLCHFGEARDNKEKLIAAVSERINNLKRDIDKVKSWFDPFKGQANMNAQKAADYVTKGEPKFLRELQSVYGRSTFYTKYLKNWKINEKSSFLKLYGKVQGAIDDATVVCTQAEEEAQEPLERCAEKLELLKQDQSSVRAKLEAALAAEGAATEEKEAAQEELMGLNTALDSMTNDLSNLKAAVVLANKRYSEAMSSLKAAHDKALSALGLGFK